MTRRFTHATLFVAAALLSTVLGVGLGAPPAFAGSYTVQVTCGEGDVSGGGWTPRGWYRDDSSGFADRGNFCGQGVGLRIRRSGTFGSDGIAGLRFVGPGDAFNVAGPIPADNPFAVRTAHITSARVQFYQQIADTKVGTLIDEGAFSSGAIRATYGCENSGGIPAPVNAYAGVPAPRCDGAVGGFGAGTVLTSLYGDTTTFGFGIYCVSAACNTNVANQISLGEGGSFFAIVENSPPEIIASALPGGAWVNAGSPPTLQVTSSVRDLMGVDFTEVLVDGTRAALDDNAACSSTDGQTIATYAPCLGGSVNAPNNAGRVFDGRTLPFTVSALADGVHNGTFRAQDGLGNAATQPFTLRVDRTAPSATPPTAMDKAGAVTFTNVRDLTSGVDPASLKADYSLNGGAFTPLPAGTYSASSATYSVTLPATLPLGPPNTVRVRLVQRDAAANESTTTSTAIPTLTAPPVTNPGGGATGGTGAGGGVGPASPAATSPEAAVCSNGRDDDGDAKTDFPADPGCNSATDSSEARELSSMVEQRVPGFTATGEATEIVQARANGATRGVAPGTPSERAGVTVRRWSTTPRSTPAPVVNGLLRLRSNNRALSGAELYVFILIGRDWVMAKKVKTSSSGAFSFAGPVGPGRRITVVFAGGSGMRGAIAEVRGRVRARTTCAITPAQTRNNGLVRFSGRMLSTPVSGRLVLLQTRVRGVWRPFGQIRSNKAGRFAVRHRFRGIRQRTSYVFRCVVPAGAGYSSGVSASRRVTVRPALT